MSYLIEGLQIIQSEKLNIVCRLLTEEQMVGLLGQPDSEISQQFFPVLLVNANHQVVQNYLATSRDHVKLIIAELDEPHLSSTIDILMSQYKDWFNQMIVAADNANFLTKLPSSRLVSIIMMAGDTKVVSLANKTNTAKLYGCIARYTDEDIIADIEGGRLYLNFLLQLKSYLY